ncbi:hypothetical protein OC842_006993 [Tilletia horrida]|uniref:CREG-like beta-barrel domain-containing protein n=1 Tax=Tilletia horrida TaxID=155126 RepID=A0AAN6JHE7_9BASI|nr:hypothetical protein OC842_006993 [Tilletia horrida]
MLSPRHLLLPLATSYLVASTAHQITSVAAWETAAEAARQARALLHDEHIFGVGVLSSVYPDDFRIPQLRGRVSSGPEYFAPCYDNGDLALMALTVSQNWRNVLPSFNGSGKATFTISSNADPSIPDPRHAVPKHSHSNNATLNGEGGGGLEWDPHRPHWRRTFPSKNRMTLFGAIEELSHPSSSSSSSLENTAAAKCYLTHHKDAAHWAPGARDSPHSALWVRMRVEEVYVIGGYGDEHAIRFLPMEDYRSARAGTKAAAAAEDSKLLVGKAEEVKQEGGSARRLFAESDVGDGAQAEEEDASEKEQAPVLLRFQRGATA